MFQVLRNSKGKKVLQQIHFNLMKRKQMSTNTFSQYRYFLPIQTRFLDNDLNNHVNNAVYGTYTDTIINNYLLWYCGFRNDQTELKRLMIHTSFDFKLQISYPQILLGAARVEKLGNSSVKYGCAIFVPKLDYESQLPVGHKDPFLDLGIGLQGRILQSKDSKIFDKISTHYHTEPALLATLVHVFADEHSKPLSKLPTNVYEGMAKIVNPPSKL